MRSDTEICKKCPARKEEYLAGHFITGNFVPCYIKTLRGDRTGLVRKMPLLRPAAGGESCFALARKVDVA
ncbi:hypothetical protein CLOM621_06923 [Clostridium sp. M62/1]|nr:hypothetical protein CLOM621_06923 [Clostridium sp. M62/1]